MSGQQILIIGIVIVGAAVLATVVYAIFSVISGKRLRKKLEEEYGKKRF